MARFNYSQGAGRVAMVVILLIALGLACNHVPVEQAAPVLTPSPGSGATVAQLDAGRAIYVSEAKCARCHSPKPVYEYAVVQWTKEILPRMGKKSKLTTDEYANVLAYVTAGSQSQRVNHAAP